MSILTRLFNRAGDYGRLVARFPGGPEPAGARWERQSVAFARTMVYKRCTTVVVTGDGLWVQARPPAQGVQPAVLVPWPGIAQAERTRLYWREAVRLTCGRPAVGTITVFRPVWEAADLLWRASQSPPPTASS